MTGYERTLEAYGSIAARSGQMLDAAKSSDWDRLIALGHDRNALVEALQRVGAGAEHADPASLQRKAELIRKVLTDDAAIRQFTEPWMNQLASYLANARQESRLRQAYEYDHGR